MYRFMILAFALVLCISCRQKTKIEDLLTDYEKSNYLETPRYDKTIAFCEKLDKASPLIKYTTFGTSPQGRDLPLLIMDKNGNFTSEKVRQSGNVVVLIQACIHAGEPEGKDAGLTLIRDLITKPEMSQLLDHVTLLFIPIFNVDGHERFGAFNRINQNGPKEMGWRTTANNLNLNRDYMKAETMEMQQWLMLYNQWLPDMLVDCHTTDGADYQYPLTYSVETHGNLDSALTYWCMNKYIPVLTRQMDSLGMPIIPYTMFRNWHDPRSGLITYASQPMLSTGYSTVQNRLGLLIETHMLKNYKLRVMATYKMIELTLGFLNQEFEDLKNLGLKADEFVKSEDFRKIPMALNFFPAKGDSTQIVFKGKKYSITHSELSGGNWFHYSDTNQDFTVTRFEKLSPATRVILPEAYIVPAEYTDWIIPRLNVHGIEFKVLKNDCFLKVDSYRFKNVKFNTYPREGHLKVDQLEVEPIQEERTFYAGSIVVSLSQRTARVIAHLFEPEGPVSFVAWGYFNAIFEQKEYGESYVLEPLAREMLAKDPDLKKEFEQLMKINKDFASDPEEILNWFYNHSTYKDTKRNVYPIGKIMDKEILKSL